MNGTETALGKAGTVRGVKVSDHEGLANRLGSESWRYADKDVLQALTG